MEFMNSPHRHHYLPQFLLRNWSGSDGKLTAFGRVNGEISISRLNPRSTGFEPDLYTFRGVPAGKDVAIETKFMASVIDGRAAPVLRRILCGNVGALNPVERLSFCRFLLSLGARHPDAVATAKATAAQQLRETLTDALDSLSTDVPTCNRLTEFEWIERNAPDFPANLGLSYIPSIIFDRRLCARVCGAHWRVYDFISSSTDLVLSDRPLLRWGSLAEGPFLIVLPVSPRMLFLSFNDIRRLKPFWRESHNRIVKEINKISALSAKSRIFASGAHHRPLAEKYLATR